MSTLDVVIQELKIEGLPRRSPIVAGEASRWTDVPRIFAAAGLVRGAEIGVQEGAYSECLLKRVPGLQLFSIDAWVVYPGYQEVITQARMDEFRRAAEMRLAPYPGCQIMQKFSDAATQLFRDNSLDFVYIDGGHDFKNVAMDVCEWSKKVRSGGIVAGHDFRREKRGHAYKCDVVDVIQAYAYAHGISPWFVLRGDKAPTWLWVKP